MEGIGAMLELQQTKLIRMILVIKHSEENGRVFLFAAPYSTSTKHNGTFIFEFDDITKARLKRDLQGKLILHKHLERTTPNGGQSSYDEQNTYGGIMMPQTNTTAYPEVFQIFNTKENIV